MGYVLEHVGEALRLEKQAKQNGYVLEEELQNLTIKSGDKVLDAGCGNGLMTRFLKQNYSNISVSGCDFSELRLKQAMAMNRESNIFGVDFFSCDLENIPKNTNSFDKIVSRYVFEHLANPQKVMDELYRVVNVGGEVSVIDFDGMFFNLYNDDKILQAQLDQIRINLNFDLFIGRKLPTLMQKSGFKNINWKFTCVDFQGLNREEEYKNIVDRLNFAYPVLKAIFKDDSEVEDFKRRYLDAVQDPFSVLFYNKIIITGQK
jgi:SAM-dependent methyltransferase